MERELNQFYLSRKKELSINSSFEALSNKNDELEANIKVLNERFGLLIENVFAPFASVQLDTMHRQIEEKHPN